MGTHLSPNAKLKPIGYSLFSGRDKSLINNKTLFTLNYWPISYFPYVSLISDMKGCDRQILGFRIIDQFWSRLDFIEVRSQVKYIHRILSLTFSFPIIIFFGGGVKIDRKLIYSNQFHKDNSISENLFFISYQYFFPQRSLFA